MAVDPASVPVRVSQFTSATGKVLAISHSDSKVIVSDTTTSPNRVTIIDVTTGVPITLPITGATAAAFTPDDLKAFIVAGSTLYVYSTVDPLQTIPLSASANDVTMLPSGAFAYLAGGAPSAVSVFTTCTPAAAPQVVGTPATPAFIRALPDASQVLAADSPGVDVITVTDPTSGCPPTVSNSVTSVNLGQGSFTPLQMLLAPDGTRAYILASDVAAVLIYNTGGQSSSAIQIANDSLPLHGTLSPDGNTLYIAASDGLVHVIDTVSAGDIQQITFPTSLCSEVSFTCTADLVAAKP
jgi:WD40 repeat protein